MSNQVFLFVFAKNGKCKVLGIEDNFKALLNDGWVLTASLEGRTAMEYCINHQDRKEVEHYLQEFKDAEKFNHHKTPPTP